MQHPEGHERWRVAGLLILLLGSASLGYLIAKTAGPDITRPALAAALPRPVVPTVPVPLDTLAGLRAELAQLRVALTQVAELAGVPQLQTELDLPVRDPDNEAGLLKQQITQIHLGARWLKGMLRERALADAFAVSGRPVEFGHLSSPFGSRQHPLSGRRRPHLGVDFTAKPGEPILALADGVVSYSGKNGSYGNLVELDHGDGFRTRYAHNRINLVQAGMRVKKAQPIALLGNSGRSTGPHVHVEVRRYGQAVDPQRYLR